jgi:hypothetical protein
MTKTDSWIENVDKIECWMWNVKCRMSNVEYRISVKQKGNWGTNKLRINSEGLEPSSTRLGWSTSPLCYEFSRRFDDISYDDLRWWFEMRVWDEGLIWWLKLYLMNVARRMTSDKGWMMSDEWWVMSDDIRCLMFDIWPLTFDLWCLTFDVNCLPHWTFNNIAMICSQHDVRSMMWAAWCGQHDVGSMMCAAWCPRFTRQIIPRGSWVYL